jgi:hypothetical protein
MHRFVWNLHYPQPDALERDYPISAIFGDTPLYPLGAAVLPRTYTVKLTAEGQSYTQPLPIKMDPRVKTSLEDLEVQFDIDTRIAEAMRRDFDALAEVRILRKKLKDLAAHGSPSLSPKVEEFDKKLAELEGTTGGYGTQFLSTPAGRSLARLNTGLKSVLDIVDSADAAPTTQGVAMFADVKKALDEQLDRWDEMKKHDLSELNQELKKAGLSEVDLKAPDDTGKEPR